MTLKRDVMRLVRHGHGVPNQGIKCMDIMNRLNKPQSVISGTLSHLKQCEMIHNENGRWYPNLFHVNNAWIEEFVSNLIDHNIINDDQFNELMKCIKLTL